MWFWLFLFICNLLVPLIMLIFGSVFLNHPPKDINAVYGYRTTMSMKNKDTWEFAHHACGLLWKKAGMAMIVPTAVASDASYPLSEDGRGMVSVVLVTIQYVVLIGSIFPVEKALKANFDSDGRRK